MNQVQVVRRINDINGSRPTESAGQAGTRSQDRTTAGGPTASKCHCQPMGQRRAPTGARPCSGAERPGHSDSRRLGTPTSRNGRTRPIPYADLKLRTQPRAGAAPSHESMRPAGSNSRCLGTPASASASRGLATRFARFALGLSPAPRAAKPGERRLVLRGHRDRAAFAPARTLGHNQMVPPDARSWRKRQRRALRIGDPAPLPRHYPLRPRPARGALHGPLLRSRNDESTAWRTP